MEDNTVRDPTACEEMEHCHLFESKTLIEVMQPLTDVNHYDEDDMEADIGKYLSFCKATLKTAILKYFCPLCERLYFSRNSGEKNRNNGKRCMYNKIWKRFLVQSDMLV